MGRHKVIISFAGGILLSGATLWLALRAVPFHELWSYFRAINLAWAVPAIGMILLSFVLRAARWQLILASTHKVDFVTAFHPMMIGFMLNCTFPGRIGELARPVILKNKTNVPFSTGIATVVAERFFDIAFMIVFLMVIFVTVDIDPRLKIKMGSYHLDTETLKEIGRRTMQAALLLLAAISLLCLPHTRRRLSAAIIRMPHWLPFAGPAAKDFLHKRIAAPLARSMEHLAAGFALLRSPRQILACGLLSIAIWTAAAFSYYLLALGSPGIHLVFLEIAAVMVIVCFFIALPSAPGFWGLWEAGGVFAMSLFGTPVKEAAGFTLANHAIQIIPVVLVGLFSALAMGVKVRQVAMETES